MGAEATKRIGLIKRLLDGSGNPGGLFGFIEHPQKGEFYFNERLVATSQDVHLLRKDDAVTFYDFGDPPKKRALTTRNLHDLPDLLDKGPNGKLPEAKGICLLASEADETFLIDALLSTLSATDALSARLRGPIVTRIFQLAGARISLPAQLPLALEQALTAGLPYPPLAWLLEETKKNAAGLWAALEDTAGRCVPGEWHYQLWMRKLLQRCPVDYLSGIVFAVGDDQRNRIFQLCLDEEIEALFLVFLLRLPELSPEARLMQVPAYLIEAKAHFPNEWQTYHAGVMGGCPAHERLVFWLSDLHD